MIKELLIKRSEWARGIGVNSLLSSIDNKKCCLGFLALAEGLTKESILGRLNPSDLELSNKMNLIYLFDKNQIDKNQIYLNNKCFNLIEFNDSEILSEYERELKIKSKFNELGILVNFED